MMNTYIQISLVEIEVLVFSVAHVQQLTLPPQQIFFQSFRRSIVKFRIQHAGPEHLLKIPLGSATRFLLNFYTTTAALVQPLRFLVDLAIIGQEITCLFIEIFGGV